MVLKSSPDGQSFNFKTTVSPLLFFCRSTKIVVSYVSYNVGHFIRERNVNGCTQMLHSLFLHVLVQHWHILDCMCVSKEAWISWSWNYRQLWAIQSDQTQVLWRAAELSILPQDLIMGYMALIWKKNCSLELLIFVNISLTFIAFNFQSV